MKVRVHRDHTVVSISVPPSSYGPGSVDLVPVRRAVVQYDNGSCTVIQAEHWREFVIIARQGHQYSEDEIGDMFLEIRNAECADPVIVLHRREPHILPETQG